MSDPIDLLKERTRSFKQRVLIFAGPTGESTMSWEDKDLKFDNLISNLDTSNMSFMLIATLNKLPQQIQEDICMKAISSAEKLIVAKEEVQNRIKQYKKWYLEGPQYTLCNICGCVFNVNHCSNCESNNLVLVTDWLARYDSTVIDSLKTEKQETKESVKRNRVPTYAEKVRHMVENLCSEAQVLLKNKSITLEVAVELAKMSQIKQGQILVDPISNKELEHLLGLTKSLKYEAKSWKETKEGAKHDQEKNRLELFPPETIEAISHILTFGAKKYTDRNWEKGIKWSRVFGATLRHLFAWWRGEDKDLESGMSHLWHAGCCITFLIAYECRGMTNFDDRANN